MATILISKKENNKINDDFISITEIKDYTKEIDEGLAELDIYLDYEEDVDKLIKVVNMIIANKDQYIPEKDR